MKVCQGCLQIRYCTVECQKLDWGNHKSFCLSHRYDKKEEKKNTVASVYPEEEKNTVANVEHNNESKYTCFFCKNKCSNIKVCGNCKKVRYCSVGCQKKDWENHKSKCK